MILNSIPIIIILLYSIHVIADRSPQKYTDIFYLGFRTDTHELKIDFDNLDIKSKFEKLKEKYRKKLENNIICTIRDVNKKNNIVKRLWKGKKDSDKIYKVDGIIKSVCLYLFKILQNYYKYVRMELPHLPKTIKYNDYKGVLTHICISMSPTDVVNLDIELQIRCRNLCSEERKGGDSNIEHYKNVFYNGVMNLYKDVMICFLKLLFLNDPHLFLKFYLSDVYSNLEACKCKCASHENIVTGLENSLYACIKNVNNEFKGGTKQCQGFSTHAKDFRKESINEYFIGDNNVPKDNNNVPKIVKKSYPYLYFYFSLYNANNGNVFVRKTEHGNDFRSDNFNGALELLESQFHELLKMKGEKSVVVIDNNIKTLLVIYITKYVQEQKETSLINSRSSTPSHRESKNFHTGYPKTSTPKSKRKISTRQREFYSEPTTREGTLSRNKCIEDIDKGEMVEIVQDLNSKLILYGWCEEQGPEIVKRIIVRSDSRSKKTSIEGLTREQSIASYNPYDAASEESDDNDYSFQDDKEYQILRTEGINQEKYNSEYCNKNYGKDQLTNFERMRPTSRRHSRDYLPSPINSPGHYLEPINMENTSIKNDSSSHLSPRRRNIMLPRKSKDAGSYKDASFSSGHGSVNSPFLSMILKNIDDLISSCIKIDEYPAQLSEKINMIHERITQLLKNRHISSEEIQFIVNIYVNIVNGIKKLPNDLVIVFKNRFMDEDSEKNHFIKLYENEFGNKDRLAMINALQNFGRYESMFLLYNILLDTLPLIFKDFDVNLYSIDNEDTKCIENAKNMFKHFFI